MSATKTRRIQPEATPQDGPRKNILRTAMISLAAMGLVTAGAGIYWMGSFSLAGDTVDKVVIEHPSPNARYVASVLNSLGGATVSNSTLVCIRPKEEKRKETSESIVFRLENVTKVGIHWDNNEQLTVDYDPGTVLYKTEAWHGVKLLYAEHRLY